MTTIKEVEEYKIKEIEQTIINKKDNIVRRAEALQRTECILFGGNTTTYRSKICFIIQDEIRELIKNYDITQNSQASYYRSKKILNELSLEQFIDEIEILLKL